MFAPQRPSPSTGAGWPSPNAAPRSCDSAAARSEPADACPLPCDATPPAGSAAGLGASGKIAFASAPDADAEAFFTTMVCAAET